MPSDALITYGPTITDLEALKAAEKERRRRIRVLQVRSQARKNAARMRELYDLKKQCLIESVASEIQEAYDRAALDDLQAKRAEFDQVCDQTGTAHLLAETWEDPQVEIERQAYRDRQCAEHRSQLATHALRQAREEQRLREDQPRIRLRSVRELEDERAALVAALPKPTTVDDLLNSNSPVHQPTVLVYDVTARNAVHTGRPPSTVIVTRPDGTDTSANNAQAEHAQNATDAAQIECERLQALEHEQCLRTRESLIKADLRGQRAMKRERVRRHYSTLMARLEELGRGDAARLRHQLSQGVGGASTTDVLVNRKLEKVFEDEVLRQFAERVPYKQDDLIEESVAHEPVINVDYENQPTAPAMVSEITCGMGPNIRDRQTVRPVLCTRDNRLESVPPSYTGIQDPIVSHGLAWSIPQDAAEDEYSSDALILSSRAPHQIKLDSSMDRLGDPDVVVPNISPAVPAELPCSTSAVIADSSESALGPGERPELPSLRARHRSARSREGRSVFSDDLPRNYTNHFLDSVLNRPEYAPLTVLQVTSAQELASEKSIVTQSERSYCPSLSEQQEQLDRELAEIDRRIARIRMGSSDFVGQETLRSEVSDDVRFKVQKAVTTETVPPIRPPTSIAETPQLTPRDSVIVEGQTARESSAKTSREADWLFKDKLRVTGDSQQSDGLESTPIDPKPSLAPLPPTLMQKLSSIITTQVREIQSARQSSCSSRSSSSLAPYLMDRPSSVCSSSTHLTSLVVGPCEGGDTLSKLDSTDSVACSETQSPVPEKMSKDPSISIVPTEKSVDNIEIATVSQSSVVSVMEPKNSEPKPTTDLCKTEHGQSFPTELHASDNKTDSMPTPRMSLTHLTNSESAVLQSIGQLASRLAQTALREASTELAMTGFDSNGQSLDPNHHPQSPTNVPLRKPLRTGHRATDEACTLSDNQSTTTRATSSSEGVSTTRSLKEELRAILTSSLISSLLNGTAPSSLNGALTNTSETLQRLLGSSCSLLDPSTDKVVKQQSDQPSGDLSSPSLPTGSSEPLSSPSDDHSSVQNGSSAAITIVSPPEVADRELDFASQVDQTQPSQTGLLPTDSPWDQSDSVRVNKNWLLGLVGSEHSKISQPQSPSSSIWIRSPTLSDQFNFHHLSPADLFVDAAESLDAPGRIQSTSPALYTASSTVSMTPRSSILSCPTTGPHLFSFKPLPRLDEAPSEESIPDLSTTPVPVLDQLGQFPLVEDETLQTPSTSWSDSRKSNEFRHLSRCCSTSNSNLNSTSGLFRMNETSQKDENDDDDQTTIHRLQTNLPLTPIEPCEALVVPCLGSHSATAFGVASSDMALATSSSFITQQTVQEDLHWIPSTLSVVDPAPPSSTMHPPVLANITRNTTTVDSSIIWDDGETGLSVNRASVPSDELLIPTGNSTQRRSPVLEVICPVQSNSSSPRPQVKSPRPFSPADGAADSTPCVLTCGLRDVKNTAYQSLPAIYVDSDGVHDTRTNGSSGPSSLFRSIGDGRALHASWSGFTHMLKPPEEPPLSLSDSLRSFQRHEISCCLLDEEAGPQEVLTRPCDSSQVLQRGSIKPDHIAGADANQNIAAIHPPTCNADESRQANGIRNPPSLSSNPLNRKGHSTCGSFDRNGRRGVCRSLCNSTCGSRRLQLSGAQKPVTPADPVELPMKNAKVHGVQHVANLSVSKQPKITRQTNSSRGSKVRGKSLQSIRSRYLSAPRRPTVDPTTPHSSETRSHARRGGGYATATTQTTYYEPGVPVPPTCSAGRSTSSLIHSSSASMEQSLYEQLRRWRAVRLGTRTNAYLLPVVIDDPLAPSPAPPASGPWSSTQAASVPPGPVSVMERVDFTSVLPGPPPLVVERNADEEISSTTLWMNEIAFQPPATLNPRPSIPTPNTAVRRPISSETAPADDDDNMATDAESSASQNRYRHVGRHPYHQSNHGSMAFIVDLDALALPSTACAGDELVNERRFPINELHFSTAPFRHQPAESAESAVGPSSTSARSTAPLERLSEIDLAATAVSVADQEPPRPMASEKPMSSRLKAPDSKSTGMLGANHAKRRLALAPEQKHREEQARINRLRVKEFDRIRRERLFRRKKKTVT